MMHRESLTEENMRKIGLFGAFMWAKMLWEQDFFIVKYAEMPTVKISFWMVMAFNEQGIVMKWTIH